MAPCCCTATDTLTSGERGLGLPQPRRCKRRRAGSPSPCHTVQPCNNLWPPLRCFWHPSCFARRVIEDKRTGEKEGVVGSAELLCDRDISCQPVAAFDWSPDKASVADCQLRAH